MDYLDLLGDPAYRHVLLNHLPIAGLAVAWLALACGLALRQRAITLLGLALVALTAGAALPVAQFGDAAYPAIYDALDGHGRAWLDHHAEVAETWLPLLLAAAAAAVLAAVIGAARPRLLGAASVLVLLLSAAALVGVATIARTGGQVQHPEFRLQATPG
ncbi:MAG: hypothetical protein R3228_00940 [Halioglobus sp.]|nr:hypothetical protein [Halioglobus sp.]